MEIPHSSVSTEKRPGSIGAAVSSQRSIQAGPVVTGPAPTAARTHATQHAADRQTLCTGGQTGTGSLENQRISISHANPAPPLAAQSHE